MMLQKVAYSNISNLSLRAQLNHSLPSLQTHISISLVFWIVGRGSRPVDQQKIEIISAQFSEDLITSLGGPVKALLTWLKFAGDIQLLTTDA
jgi:hypothetical protein